ncbi:hypothetical protein C8F04DRAFT_1280277 [Mycena alexandri]|uniref:Uncharacterized protein n=1 Tax=Mycena alexandri TaxID=1745969 RepID=A0AAD6WKG4_9AGAR|nr:hypothetical protein C8F04DRAFT_1280277 [Mycena alexandri]
MSHREHQHKPSRKRVTPEQRVKKRQRDRCVRREHREERRLKSGSALKGITQLHVRSSRALRLELNIEEYPLPVESSGRMGKRQVEPQRREYTLDEARAIEPDLWRMISMGKLYVGACQEGTGLTISIISSVPQPVIDRDNHVLLVLRGFPHNEPKWQEDVAELAARATEATAEGIYHWRKKAKANAANPPRRGSHAAESVGASMGGGQPCPMMLHHSVTNLVVFAGLFGLKCFERLAGPMVRKFCIALRPIKLTPTHYVITHTV